MHTLTVGQWQPGLTCLRGLLAESAAQSALRRVKVVSTRSKPQASSCRGAWPRPKLQYVTPVTRQYLKLVVVLHLKADSDVNKGDG